MKFFAWILLFIFGPPARTTDLYVESRSGKETPFIEVQACEQDDCKPPRTLVDFLRLKSTSTTRLKFRSHASCGTMNFERSDWRDGETVFLGASTDETIYGCFATTIKVTIQQ